MIKIEHTRTSKLSSEEQFEDGKLEEKKTRAYSKVIGKITLRKDLDLMLNNDKDKIKTLQNKVELLEKENKRLRELLVGELSM